jgi:uncharacterized protein YndB with AHSA1/START domain
MTPRHLDHHDPELDLVLERVVDVPRKLVWEAWTRVEHLKHWFVPAPWSLADAEIDVRPGGIFRTVMRSPEGQDFPNSGCYLEIVPNERLVWTSALESGFRPANRVVQPGHECAELMMTAIISLETQDGATKYTARVLHGDAESCKRHEAMGFNEGWGAAFEQLLGVVR